MRRLDCIHLAAKNVVHHAETQSKAHFFSWSSPERPAQRSHQQQKYHLEETVAKCINSKILKYELADRAQANNAYFSCRLNTNETEINGRTMLFVRDVVPANDI